MSAIAFVCKSDRVEVLTDSLAVDADTGRAADLRSKQVFVGNNAVIATQGWAVGCDMFTDVAAEECIDFDDLVSRSVDLWSVVHDAVIERFPADQYRSDPFTYYAAVAGWSHKRNRAEAYMFDSFSGVMPGRPVAAFALGGGAEALSGTLQFIRRFHRDPEAFDACRHGIPLFEAMRESLSLVGDRLCHSVGGELQHTIISADGITESVIRKWGDRVGDLVMVN